MTLSKITSRYESYFSHRTSYSDFTAECFKKYIKTTSEQRLLCYAMVLCRVTAFDKPKKKKKKTALKRIVQTPKKYMIAKIV